MNKQQEKVLVATLCGLVIAAAGAFAVQPAMAAGHTAGEMVLVSGSPAWVSCIEATSGADFTRDGVNSKYLTTISDHDV